MDMEFPDLNDLLDAEYFRHASAESVFSHLSRLPPPESYGCDNVQPRTLGVLTSRPEPLIRLGLARYCSNRETIASMLSEASATIRCAALSNRNIKHGDITVRKQIPYAIYEQILNSGEPAEILALLSNPSVSHKLLGKVVGRKIPVQPMEDQRWWALMRCVGSNPGLRHTISGSHHEVAAHVDPIRALWGLLWDAERCSTAEDCLREIYRFIHFIMPVSKGPQDMLDVLASRWTDPIHSASPDDPFENLRRTCARRYAETLSSDDARAAALQLHPDRAIRLGYYEGIRLAPGFDLTTACQRDDDACLSALAGNPTLHLRNNHALRAAAFRSAAASNFSRAAMHQIALRLAKEDPKKYGDYPDRRREPRGSLR